MISFYFDEQELFRMADSVSTLVKNFPVTAKGVKTI